MYLVLQPPRMNINSLGFLARPTHVKRSSTPRSPLTRAFTPASHFFHPALPPPPSHRTVAVDITTIPSGIIHRAHQESRGEPTDQKCHHTLRIRCGVRSVENHCERSEGGAAVVGYVGEGGEVGNLWVLRTTGRCMKCMWFVRPRTSCNIEERSKNQRGSSRINGEGSNQKELEASMGALAGEAGKMGRKKGNNWDASLNGKGVGCERGYSIDLGHAHHRLAKPNPLY
ncbi:hypothetical protein BKA70DRAFT_1293710 [Coprinopsis sp. MPI-PUGE-AT-0042]|nr:hypothetical protein BKA70DRAFT_1293710 [Coprinopsis sp. MPI-PUGE-AT-0042]